MARVAVGAPSFFHLFLGYIRRGTTSCFSCLISCIGRVVRLFFFFEDEVAASATTHIPSWNPTRDVDERGRETKERERVAGKRASLPPSRAPGPTSFLLHLPLV